MSAFAKVREKRLSDIKRGQAWARRNKVPKAAVKIMQECLGENRGKAVIGELRNAGFTELVDKLAKTFRPEGYKGPAWLAYPAHGIIEPNKKWICKQCGGPLTMHAVACSNACRRALQIKGASAGMKDQWRNGNFQEIRNAGMLKKYGVLSFIGTPKVKEKIKASKSLRTDEQKKVTNKKLKQTIKQRYGVIGTSTMDVPSLRKKAGEGVRKAYRDNADKIQAKRKSRSMAKHGVEHHMQRPEVFDKRQRYRRYEIKLGDKIYTYQGYEGTVLKHLHAIDYKLSTKAKGIPYSMEGKNKYYFPDIRATKNGRKLLIEVKSEYTFNWTKSQAPKKLFAATKHAESHDAEFLIMTVYKDHIKVIKNPARMKDLNLKKASVIELL